MCRAGPQRRVQAPPASGSRWIRVAVISSTTTISIVIAVTSPLRFALPSSAARGEERGTRFVIPDVSDITRCGQRRVCAHAVREQLDGNHRGDRLRREQPDEHQQLDLGGRSR